jgi:hypothetical protein
MRILATNVNISESMTEVTGEAPRRNRRRDTAPAGDRAAEGQSGGRIR